MLTTVIENLLSKSDLLIVFLGMFALVWRSLSIAHDLSSIALHSYGPAPVPPQPPSPHVPAAPVPISLPQKLEPAPTKAEVLAAVDQGLVDFIKKQEGFEPKAKWDYKQWTNGYGTKAAHADETITEAEAEIRLRTEIAIADAFVTKRFPNLSKGLHQALIDLTYNAGPGWETQSLGRAVDEQKLDTIKADILQYDHAGGQVLAGLKARREAEVAMIDHPV